MTGVVMSLDSRLRVFLSTLSRMATQLSASAGSWFTDSWTTNSWARAYTGSPLRWMSRTIRPGRLIQPAVLVPAALVIAFTAQELHAAGGTLLVAPPQFNGHYAFAPPGGCYHSPSAPCRRRPGSRSASAFRGDMPDGAAAATVGVYAGGRVQLQGDADVVRVEARDATIAVVLAAIATAYHVQYRSSTVLDEPISGTYSGSLSRVMGRLLADYDYVIKRDSSGLQVIIVAKRGARAVPAALTPAVVGPVRRGRCTCPIIWPPPFATRLSRQNRCSCRS